jgi:hypothetical protein
VGPTTTGTTVGLHNDSAPTCGSSTNTAPDKALKLALPMKLDALTITARDLYRRHLSQSTPTRPYHRSKPTTKPSAAAL